MAARTKARKRALDMLFEADQRSTEPTATLDQWVTRADPPVPEYAKTLVLGVAENLSSIDELLAECAEGWSVERMPSVDRALLRLAVYELLWCDDIPTAVTIDEAVELAKSLSTEESPGFVNGVLSRIAREGTRL